MFSKKKGTSHIFLKIGYYGLTFIVGFALLYTFKLLFAPIIASILLTLLVSPLINFLEAKGMKRLNAILGLYIFLILFVAVVAVFIAPTMVDEVKTVAENLPSYEMKLKQGLENVQVSLQKQFPDIKVPDFYKLLKERGGGGVSFNAVMAYLSNFFSILSLAVIVPIVTFFLLSDGHLIRKSILSMVPNTYFEMSVLLFHRVTEALKLFLRGQIIDAAAVGILTSIGLAIIGLPYFIIVGIIAGLGNLIPYLGPIIGFIPAFLIVAMSPEGITFWSLASVVIVFALVQFIEGTFVYPIAVGQSVNLHPLIVIIGVTVGGQLGGILGMLVAIPIISIVKVSFEVLRTYLKSYSII